MLTNYYEVCCWRRGITLLIPPWLVMHKPAPTEGTIYDGELSPQKPTINICEQDWSATLTSSTINLEKFPCTFRQMWPFFQGSQYSKLSITRARVLIQQLIQRFVLYISKTVEAAVWVKCVKLEKLCFQMQTSFGLRFVIGISFYELSVCYVTASQAGTSRSRSRSSSRGLTKGPIPNRNRLLYRVTNLNVCQNEQITSDG